MPILAIAANLLRALLLPLFALRRRIAARRGGWIEVVLDGKMVDLARPPTLRRLWTRRGRDPVALSRLRDAVRLAANDARVPGLLVRFRSLTAGPAILGSLRDLLAEARAAGKDVVAYLPHGADTGSLFVASAARRIVVGPTTLVAPLGFAVLGRYVGGALSRLGLEPEVIAKGTYKCAAESLVRDSMSAPHREQLEALLESRHDGLVEALARGRRVDRATAARWIDTAPHSAHHAVELGIVDAVAYDDELGAELSAAPPDGAPENDAPAPGAGTAGLPPGLARLFGAAGQPEPSRVPMPPVVRADRYLATRRPVRLRPLRRPAVGVVEIHGAIVPRVRFGVVPVASEERIVSALRAARESDEVESVLLHIDSRGGSAVASDRIHHEVSRVAAEKPVIAYLADVAASGGYYIAAAAHSIIAQPDTITGSIGVVSARVVIGPLLTRLGIHTEVVKRGARADLFSSARRLDRGEREAIERELDAFYRTFLAVVARGRRRTVEEIEPLAHGRVYSGRRAHAEGLCDHLGGFERALYQARACLGPAGKRLEPKIIQPRRAGGPARPIARSLGLGGSECGDPSLGLPPPVHSLLATLLAHPWLGSLAEPLALALETPGEHVLTYWDGAVEG